jgi:hypothetical protein
VVQQVLPDSAPVLNPNARALQRRPQQALTAASTATATELAPSFTTHQACAAGPSKSRLPHTPAAQRRGQCRPLRQALQFKRLRCVRASRGLGKVGAGSGFLLASFRVGSRSLSWSRLLVASPRVLRSNTRQAKPAEMHWLPAGRRALPMLRANPSIKRTCLRQAAYVER